MKILIPVEDRLFGSLIVRFLVEHQWPENSSFHVLAVIDPDTLENDSTTDFNAFLSSTDAQVMASVSHMVEEISACVKQAFPKAQVTHDVLEGCVTDNILLVAKEWQADLIVSGSHGRGGFNRLFLGSTSLALLNEAPCPTVLVKPDETMQLVWEKLNQDETPEAIVQKYTSQLSHERPPSKILIAVDETELSVQMIDFVMKQKWTEPAQFKLVTCLRKPNLLGCIPMPGMADNYEEKKKGRICILRAQALMLRDFYHSTHIEEELVEGDPKSAILDSANQWGADMIIVGCHRRGAAQRMVLGSVGTAVLCAAPCNTLLIRQDTAGVRARKAMAVQSNQACNV